MSKCIHMQSNRVGIVNFHPLEFRIAARYFIIISISLHVFNHLTASCW